jgi:hypothetical protein
MGGLRERGLPAAWPRTMTGEPCAGRALSTYCLSAEFPSMWVHNRLGHIPYAAVGTLVSFCQVCHRCHTS